MVKHTLKMSQGLYEHVVDTRCYTLNLDELLFNPFYPNNPFLCPQKSSENLRFSDDFRGHRNGTLG